MDDIQLARIKRFKEFKKELNIKQITLAKQLNTNPGFISQMMNGHRKISEAFAYEISHRYSWFNPDWLITGHGTMRKGESMTLPSSDDTVEKMEEPPAVYKEAREPLEMLRLWMESFENRIRELEAEVKLLKDERG